MNQNNTMDVHFIYTYNDSIDCTAHPGSGGGVGM